MKSNKRFFSTDIRMYILLITCTLSFT